MPRGSIFAGGGDSAVPRDLAGALSRALLIAYVYSIPSNQRQRKRYWYNFLSFLFCLYGSFVYQKCVVAVVFQLLFHSCRIVQVQEGSDPDFEYAVVVYHEGREALGG